MKAYSFYPFDPKQKGSLAPGCYKAFVAEVVLTGCDRVRGTIVYDSLRFTLIQSATLKRLLPKCSDSIQCSVSFQFWSDEVVAVPKLDSGVRILHSSKLDEAFR